MVNSQLIDFISQSLKKGYTNEQIFLHLVRNGYNTKEVTEAIKSAIALNNPKKEIEKEEKPKSKLELFEDAIKTKILPEIKKIESEVNKKTLIIAGIIIFLIIASIVGATIFLNRAVCGNDKHDEGETSENCCLDVPCPGQQTCSPSGCVDPVCGECQYIENFMCKDYECCSNDDCEDTQFCSDNVCEPVTCYGCQYAKEHQCFNFTCCGETECDDGNPGTYDRCLNPNTLSSECTYEQNLCAKDADCDDGKDETLDQCYGSPKICSNREIKECMNNDGFCPSGCGSTQDNDCAAAASNEPAGEHECETSLDCEDNDKSTRDICAGTIRKCYNAKITACKSGDYYCPKGCSYPEDPDCDRCQLDEECDDGDPHTQDRCDGEPKRCENRPYD